MSPRGASGAAVAEPRRGILGSLVAVPRPAVEEERPDLRVVARPRRRRRRQVGTIAGLLLFAALFAVAGFQTLIVSQQKHLDELDAGIAAQIEEGQLLDDRLAELQSPQRITTEATERLDMVSPPAVAYLQPRPDDDERAGVVPEPTPPPTTAPTSRASTRTSPSTATEAATTATGGSGR